MTAIEIIKYVILSTLMRVIFSEEWQPKGQKVIKEFELTPIAYQTGFNDEKTWFAVLHSNNKYYLEGSTFSKRELEFAVKEISKVSLFSGGYYICSKDKLYRITASKITIINKSTDFLSCLKISNDPLLLYGHRHSNQLEYLNNDEPKTLTSLNQGTFVNWVQLKDRENEHLLGIISKDNIGQHKLLFYAYKDGRANSVGTGQFNDTFSLYENVEISTLQEEYNYENGDTICVFSYNINGEFIGFIARREKGEEKVRIHKIYNKYSTRIFEETKILKFGFFRGSHFFYYYIQKGNKYYIGAGDFQYGIVLYNMAVPGPGFASVNDVTEDNHFIIYSNGTSLLQVCPFALVDEKCQFFNHKTEKKIIISSSIGNSVGTSCPRRTLSIGRYCVTKCPFGYQAVGPECVLCQRYDFEENKCVEKCSEDKVYDSLAKVCYKCQSFNLKKFDNECVDSCVERERVEDDKHVCIECKQNGTIFFKGTCVDKCGERYGNISGICRICSETKETQFSYDGECLKNCKDHQVYDINKKCYYCNEEEYEESGSCVKSCKKYSQINETFRFCEFCKEKGLIYENGLCVENCQTGYVADMKREACFECQEMGQRFEENKCVYECSIGYSHEEDEYICKSCGDNLYYDGTCLKEKTCPTNTVLEKIGNFSCCLSCWETNSTYFQDNSCVSECKEGAYVDEKDKRCRFCKDEGKYLQESDCVEKCDEPLYTNETINKCMRCQTGTMFYKNTCIKDKTCPTGSQLINNPKFGKYCKDCKEDNKVYSGGKCLDECLQNFYDDSSICRSCYCTSFTAGNCLIKNSSLTENSTYSCECKEGFSGHHCEIFHKNTSNINIISMKDYIIRSQRNYFKFVFKNGMTDFSNLSVKWTLKEEYANEEYKEFNFEDNEDKNVFLNGEKEIIFKLDRDLLKEEVNNTVFLEIIDLVTNETYKDIFKMVVKGLNISRFTLNVIDSEGQEVIEPWYIPMNQEVIMTVTDSDEWYLEKMTYKFFYMDMSEEVFALSDFIDGKNFSSQLPPAKKLIVKVKNERGEEGIIEKAIRSSDDGTFNHSINSILNEKEDYKKVKLLKTFFSLQKMSIGIEENDFNDLKDYLHDLLMEKIKEEEADVKSKNSKNVVESNEIIAIINGTIDFIHKNETLFTKENLISISSILNEALSEMANYSLKHESHIATETLTSIFRTIDVLLVSAEKNKDIYKSILENVNSYLETFVRCVSGIMTPGEQIKVAGSKIFVYIDQPGREQNTIIIQKEETLGDDFTSFSSYVNEYEYKKTVCNEETILCINEELFKNLYNEIKLLKGEDLTSFTFSVIEISSQNNETSTLENSTQFSKSSMAVKVYSKSRGEIIENFAESFSYELKFSLKDSYEYNDRSNFSCVPLNYVNNYKNSTFKCDSYFNTSSNSMTCICNCGGEIVGLENLNLANLSKEKQFNASHGGFQLSLLFILPSGGILGIFSIFFLLLDLFEEKKYAEYEKMPQLKKLEYEYIHNKSLQDSGVFSFAWYITYFKNPLLNLFSVYNFSFPRYQRLMLCMIEALLILVISIIPYFATSFSYKKIFINNRDLEFKNISVHNLPSSKSQKFDALFYSIVACGFVKIVFQIVVVLFKFKVDQVKYWKPKKELLSNYIYNEIKRDVLVDEKWQRIKMRIIAFSRMCSWKILKSKVSLDKYYCYGLYKNGFTTKKQAEEIDDKTLETINFSNIFERKESSILVPLLPNDSFQSFKRKLDPIETNDSEKGNLKVETAVKSFTLNQTETTILPLSSVQKFEKIRNKYIFANLETYDKNDDLVINDGSFINRDSFEIEKNDNFTYISLIKKESEKNSKKLLEILARDFLLLGGIFVIYLLILFMFDRVYQKYEGFILTTWGLMSLINLTIINFCFDYLMNIVRAVLLIKYVSKKKSSLFFRIVFKFFVEKYLIYLNKMRLLISKYPYDFPGSEDEKNRKTDNQLKRKETQNNTSENNYIEMDNSLYE